MFSSLRAKLIVSHVLVIVIAMTVLVLISGAYLRRYESENEQSRLQEIAAPLSVAALSLQPASRASGERVDRRTELDQLAERLDVRILVFSVDGTVTYDTTTLGNLQGEALTSYALAIDESRGLQQDRQVRIDPHTLTVAGEGALSGNDVVLSTLGRPNDAFFIGVTTDDQRLPWIARLTPRLLLVALISMGGASIAGYLLSNRIARPIAELTTAADAMTAGSLQQRVPGEGGDEIGRLVASFNAMSARVSDTNRSQRRLLADVAHELRTPLTSLQGYAQALRDDVISSTEDRSKALDVIRSESVRMGNLIVQLLDLSRLESGQALTNQQQIDLAQLIEGVQSRFAHEAESRGVALQRVVEPNLGIIGDRERLDQLLTNLLSNAPRHTPNGGAVTVDAQSGLNQEGAGVAVLRVRDTGEGIDPAVLPVLFERFRRGSTGGFGLGLSIVREIVDLHRGEIAVESQPGTGTTFTMQFPLR